MIPGTEELLKLMGKGLVENLSEEGQQVAGFDLRIGELYEVVGKGFLHIMERKTPELKSIAKYNAGKPTKVELKPNSAYVMKTVEKVNIPQNLLGLIFPRSTLYRSGIVLRAGVADPGYKGELSFGLFNFGKTFELEMGSRVAHILFFEVRGKTKSYRGQWQGGRVQTSGKEEQV